MPRALHHPVTGLAAALAVALACGAVWSFVALLLRDDAPWMVFPTALASAWGSGQFRLAGRLARALAAAALTLLGIAYAVWLNGATLIASMLGIGFGQTLMAIGAEMAFELARERAGPGATAMLVAGPVLAALVAGRTRRAAGP